MGLPAADQISADYPSHSHHRRRVALGGHTGRRFYRHGNGLQGYYSLRKFNAENFLGSAVALGILRELGPVLSAFMVTGRTGSAMAAELGSMKVTEQIDALYSMAINPIQYLVSPRIIAGLISMPLLTAIFDVVAIYGAYIVGVPASRCQLRQLLCRHGNERCLQRRFERLLKSLSVSG